MYKQTSHILIVDDDPDMLVSLSDILRIKGYQPLSVLTGGAALDQIGKNQIAVALIDLHLGDMDGLDVLLGIKMKSPETECILLTGLASQKSAIEAVQKGAFGYFQKPFDMDQVLLSIHQAKQKNKAAVALRESEERYRRLFEDSPIAIREEDFSEVIHALNLLKIKGITDYREYLTLHPDEAMACGAGIKVIDVNKAGLRLFGADNQNDFSLNFIKLLGDRPLEYLIECLVAICNGQSEFSWEGTHCTLTGRQINVQVNWYISSGHEETLSRVIVSILDITLRKHTEEKLKQNLSLLRMAEEAAKMGGWSVDLEQNRVTWSDQVAASHETPFGFSPLVEEGINFYAPEWREKITRVFSDCAQKGIPYNEEMEIITAKGKRVWVQTMGEAVRNDQGKIYKVQGAFQDITERKQAAEALRLSESQLDLFFAQSIDGFFFMMLDKPIRWDDSVDKDQQLDYVFSHQLVTKVNDAMLAQYGATREQYMGLTPNIFFAHDIEYGKRVWREFFDKGHLHVDTDERKFDGTPIWIEGDYICLYDYQGRITGHFGIQRDITGRKQSEEALQEKQMQLQAIMDYSPLLISIKDVNGNIMLANRSFEVLDAPPLNEFVGKNVFDVFPADIAEQLWNNDLAALHGGTPVHAEEIVTHKDGSLHTYLTVKFPIYLNSDQPFGICAISNDITERKQAEHQLLLQGAALEVSANAIVIADREGIIQWANPAFTKLTGYTIPHEVFGRNPRDLVKSGKQDQRFYKKLWETILSGNPWHGELVNRRKDGTFYNEEMTITPLMKSGGEISHFIAIKQDITERKQAEGLIEARLRLIEFAANHSVDELLVKTLDEVCEITDSPIGFYHFVEADQKTLTLQAWSTRTMQEYCKIEGKGLHYDMDLAGVWVDCLRQRQPVVHNDYSALPHRRGLPQGHAELVRELVVPIFREGLIVAILGIGNKTQNYTEKDIEIVSYFADIAWEISERKQAEVAIHHRVMELETLNRISHSLRSISKQEELLATVLDEALAILNTEHGSIELKNKTTNNLEKIITRGWPSQVVEPPLNSREGIAGKVFTSGEHYVSRNFASDSETRTASRNLIPDNWGGICLPIRTTQQVLGVMIVSVPGGRELNNNEIRLLSILSEMTGAALQRMQLYEQTVHRLDQLNGLRAVDEAIASSRGMHVTLNILLTHTISQLNVDAADVLLLHPGSNLLELVAGRGFHTLLFENVNMSDSMAGRAIIEHRPIISVNMDSALLQKYPQFIKLWEEEGFASYWCVPLIVKGEVKGVLEAYRRKVFTPDDEWLSFLEALAGQAAITIDNTQLFENLQRSNQDLSLAYDATIEGWSRALDLRDHETEGHTQRVTDLTLKLARAMRINNSHLTAIRRGALLHDIGKMGVPDSILLKEGKLTDDEWSRMRQHPQLAYNMLAPIAYLNDALDIPFCHHERWDGSGYPRGLQGEDIPLTARLFAVVDVWDALITDRRYRLAWSKEKALEYILGQSGISFDPQVVQAFLTIL